MKRIFIVHGWGGSPEGDWLPWLKSKLEEKNLEVIVPVMPHTDTPTIGDWVNHLAKTVGEVNTDTCFVGHSIGSQTILRFLESAEQKAGGVVLVAPWFTLTDEVNDDPEEYEIAKPWYDVDQLNFEKIKELSSPLMAIFSTNDPLVPLKNIEVFKEKLGAKIIEENEKGHFSGEDGVVELPIVLEEVLSLEKIMQD